MAKLAVLADVPALAAMEWIRAGVDTAAATIECLRRTGASARTTASGGLAGVAASAAIRDVCGNIDALSGAGAVGASALASAEAVYTSAAQRARHAASAAVRSV